MITVMPFIILFVALARGIYILATASAKKKDARQETGKVAKTARRTGAQPKPAVFTAQDADAFGLALAQDRIASGLPEWQQYYGTAADWE